MAENYGLMTGIANGIKEGMLAYQTQKQINRQNDLTNLLQGVQENPETGKLELTPEMKTQRGLLAQKQNFELKKYEPGSGSKALGGILGEASVPEEMSLAEAQEVMPALVAKMKQRETSHLDDALKQARIDALNRPRPVTPGREGKDAMSLRKEYNSRPEVKTFREVQTSFEKIKRAAEKPDAASDLSLIFGYMKMLDPGSTVREGEFANAQNAAGIPDRIANMYNRSMKGERLNPDQRTQFVNQSKNLFESHKTAYDTAVQEYRAVAEMTGIKPELIFGRGTPSTAVNKSEVKGLIQPENQTQTKNIGGVEYKKVQGGWQKVGP